MSLFFLVLACSLPEPERVVYIPGGLWHQSTISPTNSLVFWGAGGFVAGRCYQITSAVPMQLTTGARAFRYSPNLLVIRFIANGDSVSLNPRAALTKEGLVTGGEVNGQLCNAVPTNDGR